MAELKTDRQLLREYGEHGSEGAFQAIVERHLDLVFATARRGTNDNGAAQEIAQNVFIALARKAPWLQAEISVAGWLHKTALLEVRSWWRGELRRQRREETAVELGTTMKDEDSTLKALAGELDDGLLKLRATDRQALMLRYFEGRSHREIGTLLGAREDAVRMRIDKALNTLTRFFRRRGYAVPAVATTAALLAASAKAAPAGLVTITADSAFAVAGTGSVAGVKLLVSRVLGLSKTQTAVVCAALAAVPVAWEWNANRLSANSAAIVQSNVVAAREQQDHSSTGIDRLRAESLRLDAALAETLRNEGRYAEASRKLDALKGRVKGLLADANDHWPDDLPYVRVPKTVVKSLDLLNHSPTAFSSTGMLTDPALELFGISAQEKEPAEQALGQYWRGVYDLMVANAYVTNLPASPAGRVSRIVSVPPLGQPLKSLAENTRDLLTGLLGTEREKLLFDGWDQGGIQIFWPGNLWKIADQGQTFTAWMEPPGVGRGATRFGAAWSCGQGGTSTEGHSPALNVFPAPIATQFFTSWLEQSSPPQFETK